MIISIAENAEVASMPGGVVGQISFRRLVAELRMAGEITANETITHLDIRINEGVIRYRVEVLK